MKLNEVLSQFLKEGPNDPDIFKAVFMIGGPGSGKSTVAKQLFSGTGLKTVDPDRILEYLFQKKDVSPDLRKDNPDYERQMMARRVASDKYFKVMDNLIDGRLGMIIDGTGKNYNRINKLKIKLESLGYDTAAVYVFVDEETAQERNRQRARSVDPDIVSDLHSKVKRNIGAYEYIFGDDFFMVDNSTRETMQKSLQKVEREVRQWLSSPPQKPEAKEWLRQARSS
jgi:adenylate kinase family enzyme